MTSYTFSTVGNANKAAKKKGLRPGEYEIHKIGPKTVRLVIPPKPAAAPAITEVAEADAPAIAEAAQVDAPAAPAEADRARVWDGFPATGKTAKAEKAAPKPDAVRADAAPTIAASAPQARKNGKQTDTHPAILPIPLPPDFSAATHKPYLKKHAALVALVAARDLAGLEAFHINPTSTSPKALMRYRDAAIKAIRFQTNAGL